MKVLFDVEQVGPYGEASIIHTGQAPALAITGDAAQWLLDECGYGELRFYRLKRLPMEFNGQEFEVDCLIQKSDEKMLGFFTNKVLESGEFCYIRFL